MNSALRGTATNMGVWEQWPTDKTVQQLGDGSGDKLLSLSSPLSSMSTCCAELSGDTPFIGLALNAGWLAARRPVNFKLDGGTHVAVRHGSRPLPDRTAPRCDPAARTRPIH